MSGLLRSARKNGRHVRYVRRAPPSRLLPSRRRIGEGRGQRQPEDDHSRSADRRGHREEPAAGQRARGKIGGEKDRRAAKAGPANERGAANAFAYDLADERRKGEQRRGVQDQEQGGGAG